MGISVLKTLSRRLIFHKEINGPPKLNFLWKISPVVEFGPPCKKTKLIFQGMNKIKISFSRPHMNNGLKKSQHLEWDSI